jgi:class 3 adenylate cyclase
MRTASAFVLGASPRGADILIAEHPFCRFALASLRRAPMLGLPTGTVTFLFTDIEGSTTLLQRLGDGPYAEVLEEHRRLLRAAFQEGGGQEVSTQGDAFLVAFHRARDAVAAAVVAQRALTKHAWPDGTSLSVRIALHTGEPVSETGGYVGLDVHRAARICAAGHGGQILGSQAVEVLAVPDLTRGAAAELWCWSR